MRKAAGLPEPEDASSEGKLMLCASCGCRTNLSKKFVYEDTLYRSIYDESTSFYSGYNFMNETLISTVNLQDLFWKIEWYTIYLQECSNISICLNEMFYKIVKEEEIEDELGGYSDRIYQFLDYHAPKKVDMERSFPVTDM